LPNHPKISAEQFIVGCEAAHKRLRILTYLSITLVTLSAVGLIAMYAIKFFGGPSNLVRPLGIFAMFCAAGSLISWRMTQPIVSKFEEINKFARTQLQEIGEQMPEQVEDIPSVARETKRNTDSPIVSLTIGFANISGDDLSSIASEDASLLSPHFARSTVAPANQVPKAEIIFVYAHLNMDGTIQGLTDTGIRQIVEGTNAAIVVLASPNSPESVQKAAALPGPKTANIVFTLDRNGSGFSRFFDELFEKMRDGKDMLSAWVELAPQNPGANSAYAPQTLLLAEGGKIAFPH
jgi:hypothetical protein